MKRRNVLIASSLAALTVCHSHAQPIFSESVTIVVPFPAGGGTDSLARMLANRLSVIWNVPVLVENKPGAGTTIATTAVARAAPDGRTLIMASLGHAVSPSLFPKLPYDPIKSFSPIALVASGPNLLLVHPTVKAENVHELVDLAKRSPGKIAYASFGNGTSAHLAGELFALEAGIELLHVPYKGSAPAMTDLIGGQVQILFDGLPSLPHVKAGRVKALGVTSAKRHPLLPDLPTMVEQGLPGMVTGAWFGLLAPVGIPSTLISRINSDVRTVLRQESVQSSIKNLGFSVADEEAESFSRFLSAESEKWARVVKSRKISAD